MYRFHIALFFDYGYKVKTFFLIYKFFLIFFRCWCVDLSIITNFVFMPVACVPPFSGRGPGRVFLMDNQEQPGATRHINYNRNF